TPQPPTVPTRGIFTCGTLSSILFQARINLLINPIIPFIAPLITVQTPFHFVCALCFMLSQRPASVSLARLHISTILSRTPIVRPVIVSPTPAQISEALCLISSQLIPRKSSIAVQVLVTAVLIASHVVLKKVFIASQILLAASFVASQLLTKKSFIAVHIVEASCLVNSH